MDLLRRSLTAVASVWLVIQLTSLTALVALACCGSEYAAENSVCHRAAAANRCPMRAADGTPCLMHRRSADEHVPTLRGPCSAAMAVAVLFQPGVPLSSITLDATLTASPLGPVDAPVAVRAIRSPDVPPPRA